MISTMARGGPMIFSNCFFLPGFRLHSWCNFSFKCCRWSLLGLWIYLFILFQSIDLVLKKLGIHLFFISAYQFKKYIWITSGSAKLFIFTYYVIKQHLLPSLHLTLQFHCCGCWTSTQFFLNYLSLIV